ncbi:rano class II histocompatibility antigen, B alpha chain-like [Nelusetta ayraudi]|uniref:rano class II histocompatibility antigen, B alpha chain-like n=1 Tax=Nelusetta ayraudi TaxID=303726 RepID=UPI003F71798F
MMKAALLLFLSCVSAHSFHEDVRAVGCSESDGESMFGLDGEEMWYADYERGYGVNEFPPFARPTVYAEGTYERIVADQDLCTYNMKTLIRLSKNATMRVEQPSSPMIYITDNVVVGRENTLICFVSHFYPAPITISWSRNGEVLPEGTSKTPYPQSDETFTQISRLDFTPQHGDKYNCTVTHKSLSTPLTRAWEVEAEPPSIGPAVFCGFGLAVGLLGIAVGTFFLIKGNECR